jgi:hypothetical protein
MILSVDRLVDLIIQRKGCFLDVAPIEQNTGVLLIASVQVSQGQVTHALTKGIIFFPACLVDLEFGPTFQSPEARWMIKRLLSHLVGADAPP